MRGGVEVKVEGTTVVHLATAPPIAAKVLPGPVLMLIGSAAGLLEGDTVTASVDLAAGARLTVRTVAATLAHPCPGNGSTALDVTCRLAAGARLAWLPEPLIACAQCRHRSRTALSLGPGAAAVWQETFTLGRTGERPGSVEQRLDVELDAMPLLREALRVGDGSASASQAVLGGARHVASVHLLGIRPAAPPRGTMALAGPGATVRLLARRAEELQPRLSAARASFLESLALCHRAG